MNALTPSLTTLTDFFAGFPLGTVIFSADRKVISANPSFVKFTGLPAEQLIGLAQDEFDRRLAALCEPGMPYRPCWRLPANSAVDANSECSTHDRHHACHCDFQIVQPEWRRLRRTLQRSPCDDGVVLYFQDITRESVVDQMKSDFVLTSAHELRTPLTMIMGYSEMLLMEDMDDAQVSQIHRSLFRQCRQMAGLLDDMLDLARLESNQHPLPRKPTDLGQLALLTCGNYQRENDPRRPRISIESDSVRILSEHGQIMKCIRHLLDNAYHYSFNQGDIVVRVTKDPEDGWAVLDVSDQGIGMTPEQISKAFEPFWRADSSGKHPGTGLGLAIVSEIMRRHGGVARILSTPAQGTTVQLRFPPIQATPIQITIAKES